MSRVQGFFRRVAGAAAIGLAFGFSVLPLHAAAADAVPAEAFFKRANLRGAEISPSGRWLAVLTGSPKTRVGIAIIDLEGKEPQRYIDVSQSADVNWVEWVNEDWLVFTIEDPDQRGYEARRSGLMAVRRDGSSSRLLIKRNVESFYSGEDVFQRRKELTSNHRYVGLGAPGTDDVVVEEIRWDTQGDYTHSNFLYLNVATGGTRSLYKDGPKAQDVLLDSNGKARVLWYDAQGQTTVWWSDTGDAPWREISRTPTYEKTFTPLYVEGPDSLVVATDASGRGELRRFNVKTGKMGDEAFLAVPGFSMNARAVGVRGSSKVLGLRLYTDAASSVWFDPELQRLQDAVDAKLPGRVNRMVCTPCDKPKAVLVESYSDQQPVQYILYRPAENRWQLVGEDRPGIDPARMAGMEFVRTKARDGHDLPIWITRSATAKKPAPAVVLVHGGPYVPGSIWSWRSQAQFLASRGYVVIEPEFRGTTGYGYDHFRAGWKQWGLKMQDDISDSLKYAVAQGIADPARACIVGGSYGGYAALMGLVKDPDQYRCGVAFAAVTDLRAMTKMFWSDMGADYRDYGFPVLVGDLTKDADRLNATSPLQQVARIKAPVLLAHGGMDRRVPREAGEQMRDALQQAGKKVDWVFYKDEGHVFARDENIIDFWTRAESFLATHLK